MDPEGPKTCGSGGSGSGSGSATLVTQPRISRLGHKKCIGTRILLSTVCKILSWDWGDYTYFYLGSSTRLIMYHVKYCPGTGERWARTRTISWWPTGRASSLSSLWTATGSHKLKVQGNVPTCTGTYRQCCWSFWCRSGSGFVFPFGCRSGSGS